MTDTLNATDSAEKAYAAASSQVSETPAAKADAAPASEAKPAAVVKPTPVAKKTPAKRAPARKAPAAKAKPVPAPVKAASPAKKAPSVKKAAKTVSNPIVKKDIKTMATTAKKTAEDFQSKFQAAVKDAQARAQEAFEKGQAAVADANEFSKGNLEALVESGKILGRGMQDMGKVYVEEVKSAFETARADVKELTAVKSPKEFFELQGKLVRKNFDSVVAYNSKSAEAMLKLANDVFQPLSTRVSLAVEKVRKAA